MKRSVARSRTTLTGIAQAAGVSEATVQKVVNGHSDVAPETRTRVERLLVEHAYVARGPRGAQSPVRTVGLTFDQLVNPDNLVITHGVTEAAAEAGVDVAIGTAPDDPLGAAWTRKIVGSWVVMAFGGCGDGEKGVCEHRQGDPAVPGGPSADLVLVQAGQALAGLGRVLNGTVAFSRSRSAMCISSSPPGCRESPRTSINRVVADRAATAGASCARGRGLFTRPSGRP